MSLDPQKTKEFREALARKPKEDLMRIVRLQDEELYEQVLRIEDVFRNKLSHLVWQDGTPIEGRDFTTESAESRRGSEMSEANRVEQRSDTRRPEKCQPISLCASPRPPWFNLFFLSTHGETHAKLASSAQQTQPIPLCASPCSLWFNLFFSPVRKD